MKFRLYPNKEQQRSIDNIIHCLQVYHNNVIHDMKTNFLYTKEADDKENPGSKIHWPDWDHADELKGGMKNKEFYKKYVEADERLKSIPSGAFSGNTTSIINDMKKAWESTGKCPVERWECKKKDEDGNKINIGVSFYSKSHPRKSFSSQITANRFKRVPYNDLDSEGNIQYKNNVMLITIPKVGLVKARGWNKDIRFDESQEIDFLTFCEQNPKKQFTCTISKDGSCAYYISVSMMNKETKVSKGKSVANTKPIVWKNAVVPDVRKDSEGVDVGEINIAILSDGTKYDRVSDHNKKVKKLRKKIDYYNQRHSKMWGYRNEDFKAEMKRIKTHNTRVEKQNENLPEDQKKELLPLPKPSNQYLRMQRKINDLNRKIVNIREDYQHKVSKEIVTGTNFLGIETLKVKDMQEDKEKTPEKTNRQIRKHNKNLSEAAMYDFLRMIKYKSEMYNTILREIGEREASTCVCSVCWHKVPKIDTRIRKWDCPKCGTYHDRDQNAAEVIRQKALKIYEAELKQHQTV